MINKKTPVFIVVSIAMVVLFAFSKTDLRKTTKPCANQSLPTTQPSIFTSINAQNVLNAFNATFYDNTHNIYFSTSKRNGIGAIWTQAIFWDIAMDAYLQYKRPEDLKRVNDIYQGDYKTYDGFNWNNQQNWFIYDDMMWWVISLTNAYTITKNAEYLQHAKEGFAHVWAGSYDPINGGMFWNFTHSGKNSCINYPTVIAGMKLFAATGDSSYFNKAKQIYTWSRANLMNTTTGQVADNKIGNNPPGFTNYTYNAGTCIGAAVLLFKATKDPSYLNDANLAASYTENSMCNADGILPAEGDWNEQGVMKAIFAQYIYSLIYDAGQTQYLDWIKNNITAAWTNKDPKRLLMYRDYTTTCPSGSIQSYEASSGVAFMQLFNKKISQGH